jgi:MoaA/NifB/PqqE/SkfB family radical SAM enzyme
MEMHTETGDDRSATLMVHLLGRCNLTCLHCYMEGGPSRREKLPLDLVLRAIGECEQLGIATLYLTGGEPLLYPGLEEVLFSAGRVPKLEIKVCTNATLIRPHHAALLKDVGATVNISVDGDEEFHDRFRNLAGAFRSTERGLHSVVAAGIAVTVVTTISQANLHLLPSMVEWAANAGVVQFRAQPLLRLGRGIEISDQCLTKHDLDRLVLQLTDLANTYRSRGLKVNLVGASRSFLRKHPCGAYVCNGTDCHRRVAQEIKKLVIREDGTVLPEITNLSHEFAIGSIEDGPLLGLLHRYFEDGYKRFDQLCRSTFAEVLPSWDSEFVPWDQIVAERSRTWRGEAFVENTPTGCGTCGRPPEQRCEGARGACIG